VLKGELVENIYKLLFLPERDALVSLGIDNNITIWDLNKMDYKVLKVHKSEIRSFSINSDGKYFLSLDDSGKIVLSDVENMEIVQTFKIRLGPFDIFSKVFLSPDATYFILFKKPKFKSYISIFDLKKGKKITAKKCGEPDVVFFTEDSKNILFFNANEIKIIDVEKYRIIKKIKLKLSPFKYFKFLENKFLIFIDTKNNLFSFNVENNELKHLININEIELINFLDITEDFKYLVISDGYKTLFMIDLETKNTIKKVCSEKDNECYRWGVFNSKGDLLALKKWAGPVEIWQRSSKKENKVKIIEAKSDIDGKLLNDFKKAYLLKNTYKIIIFELIYMEAEILIGDLIDKFEKGFDELGKQLYTVDENEKTEIENIIKEWEEHKSQIKSIMLPSLFEEYVEKFFNTYNELCEEAKDIIKDKVEKLMDLLILIKSNRAKIYKF